MHFPFLFSVLSWISFSVGLFPAQISPQGLCLEGSLGKVLSRGLAPALQSHDCAREQEGRARRGERVQEGLASS